MLQDEGYLQEGDEVVKTFSVSPGRNEDTSRFDADLTSFCPSSFLSSRFVRSSFSSPSLSAPR